MTAGGCFSEKAVLFSQRYIFYHTIFFLSIFFIYFRFIRLREKNKGEEVIITGDRKIFSEKAMRKDILYDSTFYLPRCA